MSAAPASRGGEDSDLLQRNADSVAVLELDHDMLLQHFVIDDASVAARAAHAASAARKLGLELGVRVVFVSQAAHEATAAPRDLRRIERRLLILRHLHRDGRERLEEAPAAELAAARVHRSEELRL